MASGRSRRRPWHPNWVIVSVAIKLYPHHLESIRTHAESTYPEECCGIMLGHLGDDGKTLVEVWATENAWGKETADDYPDAEQVTSRRRRYAIAPIDLLKAQREAQQRHLSVIGIYHSHPDHPAIPSHFDVECAWQQYSYIIISVQRGLASDFKSWILNDARQFQSEEIVTFELT